MNYYPFHIGDYASHTRGLQLLEDLAYRRMIDEYYLAERPLNGCSTDVARLIGMAAHESAVEYILNRYFVREGDSWVHPRVESELQAFKKKQKAASRAGKASAQSRINKAFPTDVEQPLNVGSTLVERPSTNQEPITNNQRVNTAPRSRAAPVSRPDDIPQDLWADFTALRVKKRAPLTTTALKGIQREADKAGLTLAQVLTECCARGWQGFKAEWVANRSAATPYQQAARDRVAEISPRLVSRPQTINEAEVIDAPAPGLLD